MKLEIAGGHIFVEAVGRDAERRVKYQYRVVDSTGTVVTEGTDLRSGVGAEPDEEDGLTSLLSFLLADAERYRATMSGTVLQEWCYMNEDEISIALAEREED